PSTTIKYSIPNVETHGHASVQLIVYDILGREVATLVNKQQKAGYYEATWNAANNSSGVYFYRLETNTGFSQTKKMLLLR
ncbi:MAG: T9SS type A sorting domain-containing protein, partial [Melioribacteraceae bacterium]|nr:T9SS type A sorting domain-containing protein [Melioribacteraceae bacterium]